MKKPGYIAIVDDDHQLAQFLQHALEEAGYEATATTSGKQIMEQIHARRPDLLILDLNMPEPDGFALMKAIRAEHPYLRMIAISGYLKGPALDAARFIGAVATLEKPFAPDALVNVVRAVLG